MSALNHLLSPALLRAVGFTLLHSLWQGAVVALSAAILLILLPQHRAAVRYRVLLGALALVVALSAVTFVSYLCTGPANTTITTSSNQSESGAFYQAGAGGRGVPNPSDFASQAKDELAVGIPYVERNLPLLVGAWLLGILAMTLRFLAGLASVRRLRRYRVAALPVAWQQRLNELCAQAGLARRVQLLASALVPSPVVLGYFKPVILLPVSAATGLSPRELEMILAHEVAHVLRQDYLVNLLQALAEVVFFYHPAVWFLSGSLRIEREHCCDDVATQLCGDPRTLAQALSSLAELTYAEARAPRLVLAAMGPNGQGSLLARVRRLVMQRPAEPTFLEEFWAACIVLLSAGLLAFSTLASLEASARPAFIPPNNESARLTKPADLIETEMKKNGLLPNPNHYEYTLRAKSLVINGTVQPAAVADKYRRLYEAVSGEKMWPLISSLYRNVHDDGAPVTSSK